jgi:hypothetical protein
MKHLGTSVFAVVTITALLLLTQHQAQANNDEGSDATERARIEEGFRIAPVQLNFDHNDRKLVGLGSYLVNAVGGCNDCHTNPSYLPTGDPFRGLPKVVNSADYLAGGQQFGPFTSRSLTPENGLPAGHTFPEFKNIIRTGFDYDHLHPQISPLLQVMPWPTYQSMTDHEILAIYEYLRAIPPATPGP